MASEDDDLCYDEYFDQLKEVFNGCDDDIKGYLTQSQLRTLCDKLELEEEKQNLLLAHIESENCIDKIHFDDFKGAFLNLLKENSEKTNNSPSGISPKFVLGTKKYGRRTKPECEKNHDVLDGTILEKSNNQCSTNSLLLKPSHHHNLSSSSIIDQREDDAGCQDRSTHYSDQSIGWERDHADETFESEGHHALREVFDKCPLDVSANDLGMERLHEIWTELGVGKDGFLTLDELSLVCQHVGMKSMTDSDIQNIFENLDGDRDGKVSFNEFIQGFLHHATDHHNHETSLSPISRVPQSVSKGRRGVEERGGTVIADGGVAGLFSSIDTQHSGFARPSDVIELWERVGIHRGANVLTTLGFELDTRINLSELSFSLERELLANNNQDILYQAALATYQQEIKSLRFNLENISNERDKLRVDLSEANTRNTNMAKEADDRHINLEKSADTKLLTIERRYIDQIKTLQVTLDEEREYHSSLTNKYQKQLEEQRNRMRIEESSLREQLDQAILEADRLEIDMAESAKRLTEAEKVIGRLQKELETTGDLRLKIAEYERNHFKFSEEAKKFTEEKLGHIEAENKDLKDRNDELTAEIEGLIIKSSRHNKRNKRRSSVGSRIPIRSNSLPDHLKPSKRKHRSLASYPSTESEIEEDEPIGHILSLPIIPTTDLPSPDLPSPANSYGSGNEQKVAHLQKELRENQHYLERERKEIEHAYRLEISQLEERHIAEKEILLRNVEEAKVKEKQSFKRAKEELSANMQMELQNTFALEKQDLVLKHESAKNLLEHKASEEKRKLSERLKEEYDRDLTQKMIELKNEFNTERTKLENTNQDQMITIQNLKRQIFEVDLKLKLQDEEWSLKYSKEKQELLEHEKLEFKHLEMTHKQEIAEYDNMLCGGVDCLQGKLREDFYHLLSQQKEEELIVERSTMLQQIQQQHVSSSLQNEQSKLYEEFETEKAQITEKYEQQIITLKTDLQNLQVSFDSEKEEMIEKHRLEKETLVSTTYKNVRQEFEEEYTCSLSKLKTNYEAEKDSLEVRNRMQEEEIEFLQREAQQKEEHLKKIEELNSSLAQVEQDKSKVCEENEKLTSKMVNRESELNKSIHHLQQELSDVKSIRDTLQQQIHDTIEEKETLEFQLLNLKMTNEVFEKKVEELKSTKKDLENRIDELLEDQDTTITSLNNDHLEALNQSQLKEKALQESFLEEKSLLTCQITTLTDKVEQLQQQIDDIVNLQNVNDKLTEERVKLIEENKQYSQQLDEIKQQNKQLQEAVDEKMNQKFVSDQKIEQLNDKVKQQHHQIEELHEIQVKYENVVAEKDTLEKRFMTEFEKINMASQQQSTLLLGSENKENNFMKSEELDNSNNLLIPTADQAKVRLLQEELHQMMCRKDEYKRLAENLRKQLQEMDKVRHKNDKDQVINLQKERHKFETILKKITDQLFESVCDLTKSQCQSLNQVESWKETTSDMANIDKYSVLQLQLCEQQRLVLSLQKALRDQSSANEKLHKELVQEHSKKMSILQEENQRLLNKSHMYRTAHQEISENYRSMLTKNKDLFADNNKLLQTLRDSARREKNWEKKCHQLNESCTALQKVLHKTYQTTLAM